MADAGGEADAEGVVRPGGQEQALRLWPGVVLVTIQCLLRFGVPWIAPGFEGFRIAFAGGFLGAVALAVWWIFFSRAPGVDRWGVLVSSFLALGVTWLLNHESMGLMWCLGYAVPFLGPVLVAWAVVCHRLPARPRRAGLVAALLVGCGGWTLLRTEGMTGDHVFQFKWRWSETAEERLLREAKDAGPGMDPLAVETASTAARWPGFRGPARDGTVDGTGIVIDGLSSRLEELWRSPVGPGWSSLAVLDHLVYTQEQRGEDELVTCYDLRSGKPIWRHRDRARFFESMGGVGPRATPSLDAGRVFALGATGILNALDATDGRLLWSRNVASDSGVSTPVWGFAGSPLVVDNLVIVAASGTLLAHDPATGDPRWRGPDRGHSYSSPQLFRIQGVDQVVHLAADGAAGVLPADGTILWENPWKGPPIVQPALTETGDLLTSAGEGYGVRRLALARGSEGWTVEELWTSPRLKPNFNDFVVHGRHAYGFDGGILACIDLEEGQRSWKGGRYGHGQLILLAGRDILLVLTESGDLALVEASPRGFSEIARFPAIEGKCWNHPVLVGDVLLVRSDREMAAFRLAP